MTNMCNVIKDPYFHYIKSVRKSIRKTSESYRNMVDTLKIYKTRLQNNQYKS